MKANILDQRVGQVGTGESIRPSRYSWVNTFGYDEMKCSRKTEQGFLTMYKRYRKTLLLIHSGKYQKRLGWVVFLVGFLCSSFNSARRTRTQKQMSRFRLDFIRMGNLDLEHFLLKHSWLEINQLTCQWNMTWGHMDVRPDLQWCEHHEKDILNLWKYIESLDIYEILKCKWI